MLGDIPPDRILWNPPPGTATEADQIRICETDRLVELIDGVLVEKAMERESYMAASLIIILGGYVTSRNLGIVSAPDLIMRIRKGRNRLPGVTYTSWNSVPPGKRHLKPVIDFAPDVAVEILSKRNTKREIARKRREYFQAGVKLVWIFEPKNNTVAVYTDPDTFTLLQESDTLSGGKLIPGFSLRLADFFNAPPFQSKA